MKQFLVLLAILPLVLVFFAQFTLDQINASRIGILTDLVYMSKEEARQDGCYTSENLADLKKKISESLGISESSIEIDATRTVKYRIDSESKDRGLIHIRIRVPIGSVMAGKSLFGVKKDNTYNYTIESYAASEKLQYR